MYSNILSVVLLAAYATATPIAEPAPRPGPSPQGLSSFPSAFSTGSKGLPVKTDFDTSGGSGPYPASIFTDPSLTKHTIYAPKTAVNGTKLPLIIWGNGLCAAAGAFFANFLTEIASHGFIVIANGAPGTLPTAAPTQSSSSGGLLDSLMTSISLLSQGMTTASWQGDSMKWVFGLNGGQTKWGQIDLEKIAAAGQSCGGIESYTVSLADPRIKHTVLFNSGYIDRSAVKNLKSIKSTVAYFLGDVTDVAFANGKQDFEQLPAEVPALLANADVGHLGGFFEKQGGVNGRIAVPYFKWILKGDEQSKKMFFSNPSPFAKDVTMTALQAAFKIIILDNFIVRPVPGGTTALCRTSDIHTLHQISTAS
ncbi:hypothetical protein BT63DRAFT_460540 [Microthyrium microscopicum]|uniref:Alpha/beta-hydrolase n=1 Tax=Microthyrium microscopicum TaxID=703497 RepID=A0A6A6TYJ4_9PEZI|nr:hypothetical protein BT63DRAFT_460540 [Microthyrium microscopicum]